MNRVELSRGRRRLTFSLPSAWEELTARQVMAVCRLYRRGLDEANFTLSLCVALMPKAARRAARRALGRLYGQKAGLRNAARKKAAGVALLDLQSQLLQLAATLSFVKQPGAIRVNPVPALRVGFRRLYGCAPDLSSCTYEQYAGADNGLRRMAMLQKSDPEAARRAMCQGLACLWLPRAKNPAALARAMAEESVARRARRIARLPAAVVEAMLLTAQSGVRQLAERFPQVFAADGDDESDNPWGHAGLIVNLAGEKFGDVEKTAATKLYTLLMYVDIKVREAEKIRKKMKDYGS